jgi:hypothetical protein
MEFQSIVRSLSASNAKVLLKIAQTTTNAFLFCALISFWTVIAHGVRNSTKSPTPCLHGWPEDGLSVMASTNKALAATADHDAGPATRAQSSDGGKLHAVRICLGIAGAGALVVASFLS